MLWTGRGVGGHDGAPSFFSFPKLSLATVLAPKATWKAILDNFRFLSLTARGQQISMDIIVVCIKEATKPIWWSKWGHFDRAKPIFKILLASWTFYIIEKGFRYSNSENLGSVGQRAAKLQAIKLCACTLFGLYDQRVCKCHWPGFENAQGQIILKVWWPVTLQPFDLQTPNFQNQKI